MLKLVIGNKTYSSWSLRGWLAVKQSGLPFEEIVWPMFDAQWEERRRDPLLLPSNGKVPILWDGPVAVWDSLAIIEWLADRMGRETYWPLDDAACALARSMAAEMHSSYQALRQHCTMNVRRRYEGFVLNPEAQADVARIDMLWTQARQRYGTHGPYLFSTFGAADIMFAPVVTRFRTYDIKLSETAQAYVETMFAHPWMQEWLDAAAQEPWVIDKYEF